MGKFVDLTGRKFGMLKAICVSGKYKSGQMKWLCECDCGNEVIVCGSSLIRGLTKSCGCSKGDMCRNANIKHGMIETRLYRIWSSMKSRCFDANNHAYSRYGGNGITMCDEWKDDFSSFYEWSIANGYNDNLTIDRVDNEKGYYPSNCRWATYKEQCNNTSRNRYLTAFGETHTVAEWSNIKGVPDPTIRARVFKYGWSAERALTEKVRGR